ncbi:hypothetical protein AB6809_26885 [Paraburkholderia sp. RCC_158]|uniref:hypothetical protein n=1 Tax=Paraburkholderia sp. RCC_158 TaxID=3239220 RepID=UPI0035248FAF
MSDAQRPTPDAQRPTPNARRPTPNAQRPTPDARRPTPDAQRPTPNAQRPTPNARRPTPNAQRPTPVGLYSCGAPAIRPGFRTLRHRGTQPCHTPHDNLSRAPTNAAAPRPATNPLAKQAVSR